MKKYDFDYVTQFKKEYYYLKEHGVRPITSVKDENEVITFRYRRSAKLFKAVAEFYEKYENERMFDAISKVVEAIKNTADGNENPLEGIMTIDPNLIAKILRPTQKAITDGNNGE